MKKAKTVFYITILLTFLIFKSFLITLFLMPLEMLLIFGIAANYQVETDKMKATEKIINSDKI